MKIILYTLFILLSCITTHAQKTANDYEIETREKKPKKKLQCYQYIIDHYPHNKNYPNALLYVANFYYTQKKFRKALPLLRTILNSNFEKIQVNGFDRREAFSSYKHNACMYISDIYYSRKQYDSAMYYLALADTGYNYASFCGDAIYEDNVDMASRFARLYIKFSKPDLALKKILPYAFSRYVINNDALTSLKTLLKNIPDVKNKLDTALANMYTEQSDDYFYYYITFLNTKINIHYNDLNYPYTAKIPTVIQIAHKSECYEMILTIHPHK